jgi:hypothetical protein
MNGMQVERAVVVFSRHGQTSLSNAEGAERARGIAAPIISPVREAVGL